MEERRGGHSYKVSGRVYCGGIVDAGWLTFMTGRHWVLTQGNAIEVQDMVAGVCVAVLEHSRSDETQRIMVSAEVCDRLHTAGCKARRDNWERDWIWQAQRGVHGSGATFVVNLRRR
jgi:hypothetical protein